MRILKALLPLAIAVVLALTVSAVPATAATPASVPTWTQGQSVGYGTNLDLGALADTYLLNTIRNKPSSFNITTINALTVTGSFDSWEVDTVTQATSTYYTLGSQSAEGIKLHVVANLTMNNLPQAGTYTGTLYGTVCLPPTVPVGTSTVAVTFDMTILSTTNGATRYQVSNLAYVNESQNVAVRANAVFTGYHIPSTNLNQTLCKETVTYDNPSFTLTVDTKDQVRATFTPAWDYFNFPISDNKTWWANTSATIGATLSGTINVQGLSSKDQNAFFDNLTKSFTSLGLTVTGLSSFPIDLAKISILAGTSYIVNNGVVTDYPVPLDANYRAIASVETLSDGNQHPVYLITSASYECPYTGTGTSLPIGYAAVYAPDFPAAGAGMIVGYQLLACTGTMSLPGFELKNTSPGNAQQKIGQTENTYQAAPAQGNAIADLFLQAPYLGLILIAVVVVAVAALLLLRRRRKPAMAPPAAQPPAMPPPPPPGGPGSP